MDIATKTIDCACVIHGDAYSWEYVERLYAMLNRYITPDIRLHVYTEANRTVPLPYIKHELTEWQITRPGRGWWYKMQLFNPAHHLGPMLYFDLDTVIVNNIDWILDRSLNYFWGVRDFKYLWRPTSTVLNSSIMWWDTQKFSYVWEQFSQSDFYETMVKYHGDQDYISYAIPENQRRFFDEKFVKSWRWQCLDGGYDFKKKKHVTPGAGTYYNEETSALIFHGYPKPKEIQDPVILQHWKY